MTKGISTVMATVLMLIITIALAGAAYTYISGIFTRSTQALTLVDSYCTGSTGTVVVRNDGSTTIGSGSIFFSKQSGDCTTTPTGTGDIAPGAPRTYTYSGCSGTNVLRIRGPSNALSVTLVCA